MWERGYDTRYPNEDLIVEQSFTAGLTRMRCIAEVLPIKMSIYLKTGKPPRPAHERTMQVILSAPALREIASELISLTDPWRAGGSLSLGEVERLMGAITQLAARADAALKGEMS